MRVRVHTTRTHALTAFSTPGPLFMPLAPPLLQNSRRNGSGASDLVSAAAWEEGAAAAAGAEEEGLPLEGGSYTAFCQAIRFVYRIFAKPPHLRAACIKPYFRLPGQLSRGKSLRRERSY